MPPASYDLVTIGEALLRLTAPLGILLTEASSFSVHVAGTELNVAAGLARLGGRTAWLSVLPDNALGRRVAEHARLCGVDDTSIRWASDGRLGTYFFEPAVLPRAGKVIYDRADSTATLMQFDQFDWSRLTGARFLHLTGITAAISPAGAELVRRAVGWAREHQIPVSLDVNYRSLLWSPDRCRQTLEPLLPGVELLLVSARDAGTVFGLSGEPERVARTLGQRCRQVALTTGEAGAIGYKEGKCFVVPGYKVDILNRIGAGDSFAAGVLWGLLEGDFGRGLEFGVAMSALTLTIAGDSFSFTRQDVENLVAHGPGLNVVR